MAESLSNMFLKLYVGLAAAEIKTVWEPIVHCHWPIADGPLHTCGIIEEDTVFQCERETCFGMLFNWIHIVMAYNCSSTTEEQHVLSLNSLQKMTKSLKRRESNCFAASASFSQKQILESYSISNWGLHLGSMTTVNPLMLGLLPALFNGKWVSVGNDIRQLLEAEVTDCWIYECLVYIVQTRGGEVLRQAS